MITTTGKAHIRLSLAKEEPFWAQYMSIGTSDVAATAADADVGFSLGEEAVTFGESGASLATVGAVFPAGVTGEIHEIVIWGTEPVGGEVLSSFDESEDSITGGANDATNVRIGKNSRKLTPSASSSSSVVIATTTAITAGVDQIFKLGYFGNNANIASIGVRIETDASNYISHTFTPSTGYNVESWNRKSMAETGTVDLDDINTLRFTVTATGGGAADCTLDGVRMNSPTDESVVVVRKVLGTPITKESSALLVTYDLDLQ